MTWPIESTIEMSEGAQMEIAKGDESKRGQAEKKKGTAESIRKRSMEKRLRPERERSG